MKVQVQKSRLDTRKYFCSQHVVQHWNKLRQNVVQATSVTPKGVTSGMFWLLKHPPRK